MSTLTIRTQNQNNTTTTIENTFIDTYMPRANGEFVKVYLYLIRIMNDPSCSITLSKIADALEHTEKDILRSLSYWHREGLLNVTLDHNQSVTAIDIIPLDSIVTNGTNAKRSEQVDLLDGNPTTILPTIGADDLTPKYTAAPEPVNALKSRQDFKQILFITEQYLNKALSKSDVDSIKFFYDELDFSADLIEYLVEYCVENGHKSMHYIKAVALSWSKAGITSVDDAKSQIISYNKNYYMVLKFLGITGRNPIQQEMQLIDKWTNEYCYGLEIIEEACTRTIAAIHKPSFNYADSILNNWKSKKVKYLKDITQLDATFEKAKIQPTTNTTKVFNSTTPSFQQREYDFEALEKQLLNT